MRISGVSAPRPLRVGEDWKCMGEEDGIFSWAAKRPAARGVVAWRVGLLGMSRVLCEDGEAVGCFEERPLRLAGDDIFGVLGELVGGGKWWLW